jgi:TolB-like protein
MKRTIALFSVVMLFALNSSGAESKPQNDSIERELERFSEVLAAQLRKADIKKLTILDLVDTEKKSVRLGAFIAEETTVNLVSSTNTFVVVDRANLNKILEEHKLSRTGLENPEDIKKLGQFSGVDAIVSGTITPLKDEIRFTAKVISTRTADILGGAKGRLPKDAEVEKMLEVAPSQMQVPGESKRGAVAPDSLKIAENSKQLGDLLLKLESIKYVPQAPYGYLNTTVIFRNLNPDMPIHIAMPTAYGSYAASVIRNSRGDEFSTTYSEITGLPVIYSEKTLAEIKPGEKLEATIKYRTQFNDQGGNFGPYRFQAEIMTGKIESGRVGNLQKLNFIFDIPKVD